MNLSFCFSLCLPATFVQAQTTIVPMPVPGTMVTPTHAYTPPMLRGVLINPSEPFRFDFLIDTGNTMIEGQALEEESVRLIKYFLASLTVPEQDLWVNLSPFEQQRIIPEQFGVTEMGRDLLAQDYLLKQLTATLMYPEDELGHQFWDKVYKESQARFGTTEIPVNTFNKVWIIPEKAVIYEQGTTAFVVETHLKVMLEQDYVALDKNLSNQSESSPANTGEETEVNKLASEIIREVLIPAIEKEVNEGEHFAPLRQIYNSLILATWYKETLKQSLINQLYSDKNKVTGVDVEDREIKEKIYQKYIQAFKEGVYDYIKEEYDPVTQELIPRKYFSGGMKLGLQASDVITRTTEGSDFAVLGNAKLIEADFRSTEQRVQEQQSDQAVLAVTTRSLETDDDRQSVLNRWFESGVERDFPRTIWESREEFGKKNFLIGLEVQGEVVGLVRFRKSGFPSVEDELSGKDVYTVDYAEVDSRYWNRGYFKVLLAEVISTSFNDSALSEETRGMIVGNPADEKAERIMKSRGFIEIYRSDLDDYDPDERQRQRNFYLSVENSRRLWSEAQALKKGNGEQLELFPEGETRVLTDAAVLSWNSFVPGGVIENPSWQKDWTYEMFSLSTMGGLDENVVGRLTAFTRMIKALGIEIPSDIQDGLVIGFGQSPLELHLVKEEFNLKVVHGVEWVGQRVRSAAMTLAEQGVSPQEIILYHADSRNLRQTLGDNSVDLVYAGAISDDNLSASPETAKEVVRVLRPGGVAILDEGNNEFIDVLRESGTVRQIFSTTYHVFTKSAEQSADENAKRTTVQSDKAVLTNTVDPEEVNRRINFLIEKGIISSEMTEMVRRDPRIASLIAQNALFEGGRLKSSVDSDTVAASLDLLIQREEAYLDELKQHLPEIISYARWLLDNPQYSGKKFVTLGRATDPIFDALVALTRLDGKYQNRQGDIITIDFSSDQISEAEVDIEAYGELIRNQLVRQGVSPEFDNVVFVNEVASMAGLSEQYLKMFLGNKVLYNAAVRWEDADARQGIGYDGRKDNLEWADWLDNNFDSGRRYEITADGDASVSQIYTEEDPLQRFVNQQTVYTEVIKSTPSTGQTTTSDFAVMGSSGNKKYVKFLPLLFGHDLFLKRAGRSDAIGQIYRDILQEAFPEHSVEAALQILGYYVTYGREPANSGFIKNELYNKFRMIFLAVAEKTGEDIIRSSVLNTIISGEGVWVNLPVEASGETMWDQMKLNETIQTNYRILLFARGLNNLFTEEEVSQIEAANKGASPFSSIVTLGAFFPKGAPEAQKTELSKLIEELKDIFQTDKDIDLARARSISEYLVAKYAANLNDSINMDEVDVIVPVPSSRQFNNQIVPLASAIAERYNKPVSQNALSKIRRTQQQKTMGGAWKRIANLAGVNIANPQLVSGKTILIVDDVVTSGTSLYEAQRALMEAGAKKVIMLGFGLTQSHQNRTRVTMRGDTTQDSAVLGTAREIELLEKFRQTLRDIKLQDFVDSSSGLIRENPLEELKGLLVSYGFSREEIDKELGDSNDDGRLAIRVLNIFRFILNQGEGFSDLLDLRPINNGLLGAPYVGHDMGIKLSINPEDKPLVGVYGAAGVDVSNFLLSTNAKEGYFVSLDYSLGAIGPSVGRNPAQRYKDSKYMTGYTLSRDEQFTALSYFDALLVELEAIGVSWDDLDQIEAQREDFGRGRVTTINFKWGYLGQEPAERVIHFVTGDMLRPETIADVIPQEVDFYYQRAGVDLPAKYNLFLGWISERVSRTGHLVLDNYSYDVSAERMMKYNPQEILAGIVNTETKSNFNMGYWSQFIPQFPLRLRNHYGAGLEILQKTSGVVQTAEIDSAKLPSANDQSVPADIRKAYDSYVDLLGTILNQVQQRRSGSDVWFIFDNKDWDQLPGNVMARNERTGEVLIHLYTDEGDLSRGFMFRVNPNARPGEPLFDQFWIEDTNTQGFVSGNVLVERGFISKDFADQLLADATSSLEDYRRDDIRRINFAPMIRDVAQNKSDSTDFVLGAYQDADGQDLLINIFKRAELNNVDANGNLIRGTPIDGIINNELAYKVVNKETPTGGIDLTPNNLNLEIRRDNSGLPIPLTPQQLEGVNIEGLYPVIINITPISNLPLLLGIADRQENPTDISIRPSLDPLDRKELSAIPEKISLLN
ncbi:MAG: phosphoribosyltransferase family protein [Candidatus Omnitrophota bacterium]